MKNVLFVRRPNSLWAGLALLVAMSGALAAPEGRQDAARRVRVGGTRGVGVIHQVRVEPYGRAAVEHAYFDDDEDEAYLESLPAEAPDPPPPQDASPAILSPTVEVGHSATSSSVVLSTERSRRPVGLAGIPAGRAPPAPRHR